MTLAEFIVDYLPLLPVAFLIFVSIFANKFGIEIGPDGFYREKK